MPHPSRIFPSDVELGKRDDDHKPSSISHSWSGPFRWRRRRILLGLAAVVLLWVFVANIPRDLGSIDERLGRPLRPGHTVGGVQFGYRPQAANGGGGGGGGGQSKSPGGSSNGAPRGAPPRSQSDASAEDDHYYSGPIKFYNLAATLRAISRTQGHKTNNRNVLFAASSLKSAANLIPMACEMARRDRNYVHLVLLGRDSIPMDELLEINGVDTDTCKMDFHDGRSDWSDYSSDVRAEVAVAGAMVHVDKFMHPQVIITDDSLVEDVFFIKGLRAKAKDLGHPIIEIPKDKYEHLLWITRLDAVSLAQFHKPSVDILIHAPQHSSGSLIRLLDSLKAADYHGLVPPHLTIDLPTDVEPYARDYIRKMTWPPHSDPLVPHQNAITLHHRISTGKTTTESGALRLLESFYPADTDSSHVLLLSSQAELSPLFFQHLLFHILEYRYSATASYNAEHLLGISLSAPRAYLNASGPFIAPTIADMTGRKYANAVLEPDEEPAVPFLWQAPNADAALVFGDKWVELHDYLRNRLRAIHDPAAVHQAPVKPSKLISQSQPGWMEYVLELMRARGWSMLYPAARSVGGWATVHKELYQPPEEFFDRSLADKELEEQDPLPVDSDEPFLSVGPIASSQSSGEQRNTVQQSQPLHAMLPFDGDLPDISHLPCMSHAGDILTGYALDAEMPHYQERLRQQIGGCEAAQAGAQRPVVRGRTDDLFCFIDQDQDDESVADEDDADDDVDDDKEVSAGKEPAEDSKQAAQPDIAATTKASASPPKPVAAEEQDPAASASAAGAGAGAAGAAKGPGLDSTAKQKLAYAKALGVDLDGGAASGEQKGGGGGMKAVVEDLGSAAESADAPEV